jgi:hypothetical protein
MASREALQIAQQQSQQETISRLNRIEAILGEILSILNPDATTNDSAVTFDNPDGAEIDDAGDVVTGGFMDTDPDTAPKKSKSKTL